MDEDQKKFEVKIMCGFAIGFIVVLAGWLVSVIVWKVWVPESNLWEKICDTFGILTAIGFIVLICASDFDTEEETTETEKQNP